MKKAAAYTLIEVMMGLFIFALVSLGITATTIQTQKIAQSNLIKQAAYTYVQAYLEQIKHMPTTNIQDALKDPEGTPLPTLSVAILQAQKEAGDLEIADPLYLNVKNEKQLLINIDDTSKSKPIKYYLNMSITPTITDMSDSSFGANALPSFLVVLNFTYEVRHLNGIKTESDKLQTIINNF